MAVPDCEQIAVLEKVRHLERNKVSIFMRGGQIQHKYLVLQDIVVELGSVGLGQSSDVDLGKNSIGANFVQKFINRIVEVKSDNKLRWFTF